MLNSLMPRQFTLTILLFTAISLPLAAQKNPENRKRGTVTVYYPNSKQIHYTGQNKNHLREGMWTYFTPAGKIAHTDTYKAGKLDGERKTFINEVVISQENFSDGKPHGSQNYFSAKGQLKYIYYFTNSTLDSAKHFHPGETKFFRRELFSNNKISEVYSYSYRGKLIETQYYLNGLKHGVWKTYSPNQEDTSVQRIVTYKNGLKDGYCREHLFGYNHSKLQECYFVNDTLDGLLRDYIDGKMNVECYFRKGVLHGQYKTYSNGFLQEEVTYVNGIRAGKSFVYDVISGNIIGYGYWTGKASTHNVHLPDSLIELHSNGQRKREEIYTYLPDYTQQTQRFKTWNEKGVLLSSGQYVNELQEGKWIENYTSGKPHFVVNYKDGEVHGKCEFWYENGKKALTFFAQYNEVTTYPLVWRENGEKISPTDDAYISTIQDINHTGVMFEVLNSTSIPMQEQTMVTDGESSNYGVAESPEHYSSPPASPIYNSRDEINPYYKAADCLPGGDSAIQAYIRLQTVYPAVDQTLARKGRVEVSFIIDKKGNLSRTNISRNYTDGSVALETEAIRLIHSIPWQPPVKDGQPVSVAVVVMVEFVLPGEP